MARRRRLSARSEDRDDPSEAPQDRGGRLAAPIAAVAGDASASAALADLALTYRNARDEGRLIQAIPLEAIDRDYLHRDRLVTDEDELMALAESLRRNGQRAPIDVVALESTGEGTRFGLISGWRRLTALDRLRDETGDERFSTVLALLRRPEDVAEAYLAMIEENELRVGLSYYERARVAARAAESGAFPDARAAVRSLFATASRAKRSKIGAFLAIHAELGSALRHPTAIPERLGLRLSRHLAEVPGAAERVTRALRAAGAEGADDEMAVLQDCLRARPASNAAPVPPRGPDGAAPAARLDGPGRIVIEGPGVDAALRDRLAAWLSRDASRPEG